MDQSPQTAAERIAQAATTLQQKRTGHQPESVSVVVSGETLVVTLRGALSPAELALARSAEGAATVQEFHRQLFHSDSDALREEIRHITGMDVREASAQVQPASGTVAQLFSSGTMVQVFLLSGKLPADSFSG